MKRAVLLLLLCASAGRAAAVVAVEFPYANLPRQHWERELVWLKNLGVRIVSLPAADVARHAQILEILHRLELSAEPPPDAVRVSVLNPRCSALAREALIAGKSGVIWTDVESTFTPELHRGAISPAGDEFLPVTPLRRDAHLAAYWQPLLGAVVERAAVTAAAGPLPTTVTARELLGRDGAALAVINKGAAWRGMLNVAVPSLRKKIQLPGIALGPGETRWLPVDLRLASGPFCRQCSAFGNGDRMLYATAELYEAGFENGTLSLEFYAPAEGEVLLQLTRQPSGPYLANAHLKPFDWDAATRRARLTIPAGKPPNFRTRVALAIEPPEQSGFFDDVNRLTLGETNRIVTSYSSEALAKRSRLKLPEGWKAAALVKSPLEIDYDVEPPANLAHGEHVEFSLEADGVEMSRARPQVLRECSVRFAEAANLHFPKDAAMPAYPALLAIDQPNGREITLRIRNNTSGIRTYRVSITAPGLDFALAAPELSVGGLLERDFAVRVFSKDAAPGLHPGLVRVGRCEMPVQFLVIPRGETVSYRADLTGAGFPLQVFESRTARAVFERADGGRWFEFTWKDADRNLLAEPALLLAGSRAIGLKGATLTLAPAAAVAFEKRPEVWVSIESGPLAATYTIQPRQQRLGTAPQ